MNPQDYFLESYLKDFEYFKELNLGNHFCGRIYSDLFSRDQLSFIDLKNFIICTYELNLINQLIYTHFQSDFDKWRQVAPKILDEKCVYISHPLDIIKFAQKFSKKNNKKLIFTKEEILKWDDFIKDYIGQICRETEFSEMNPEKLFEAIKNDPDCNNEKVQNYFAKLTNS